MTLNATKNKPANYSVSLICSLCLNFLLPSPVFGSAYLKDKGARFIKALATQLYGTFNLFTL